MPRRNRRDRLWPAHDAAAELERDLRAQWARWKRPQIAAVSGASGRRKVDEMTIEKGRDRFAETTTSTAGKERARETAAELERRAALLSQQAKSLDDVAAGKRRGVAFGTELYNGLKGGTR